jgi:hypothetical protein
MPERWFTAEELEALQDLPMALRVQLLSMHYDHAVRRPVSPRSGLVADARPPLLRLPPNEVVA